MSSSGENLQALRQQIDDIDQQIIDLLKQRVDVVHQVGKHKSAHSKTVSFIRSGREATMLRDLTQRLKDTFPPAAVGTIWRMIISTSLNLEQGMSVAAYTGGSDEACYWLAREYYGSFIPISKEKSANDVIHKVANNEVAVGTLPLSDNSQEPWWVRPTEEKNDIYVFSRIPFIEQPHHHDQPVLSIANVIPEATGDDISIFSLYDTRSEKELLPALSEVFKADIATLATYQEHYHLIEVKGYLSPDDARIAEAKEKLSENGYLRYMGAYASPITLT